MAAGRPGLGPNATEAELYRGRGRASQSAELEPRLAMERLTERFWREGDCAIDPLADCADCALGSAADRQTGRPADRQTGT